MALRDDEDVAQALGINLIQSKLLAYGLGAAFAGLAGSIFATMLTSVYPSSFQLLISINVLALIIVGGMGSLPGVVFGLDRADRSAGGAARIRRISLPVLWRGADRDDAATSRGLWPSDVRQRELHAAARNWHWTRARTRAGAAEIVAWRTDRSFAAIN